MYIQKAEITNIKSIEKFEIEFPNPAGWHVLIGDNGSGKSTIVRAISLCLTEMGSKELRENWDNWLGIASNEATIKLFLANDKSLDVIRSLGRSFEKPFSNLASEIKFYKDKSDFLTPAYYFTGDYKNGSFAMGVDSFTQGFFSVAYGPYRRFEGGSPEWEIIWENLRLARLAAHLSVFNESVALTQPIKWLKELNYKTLEKNKESEHTLENLKKLINSEDFLPHNSKLEKISSDGVFFKDANETTIAVNQMSDGYRSILSLTFELIRQLVRVYGSEKVFKNIEKGEMFIDLPGVVLVDEIDAHLHPTWQTRIGQWFLKYFPNLQFIVTTHSPLVCRACEKGSIWKLAAPGSDEESGEVTGIDRERLIYGNVLDAYGTGVFGENTSISQDSNDMLNRLSELNVKSMMGLINDKENIELQKLRAKFPTENANKK